MKQGLSWLEMTLWKRAFKRILRDDRRTKQMNTYIKHLEQDVGKQWGKYELFETRATKQQIRAFNNWSKKQR